jgi:Pal1 cell morphology protein
MLKLPQAQQYILDPLIAPESWQETGPGMSYDTVSKNSRQKEIMTPTSPTSPINSQNTGTSTLSSNNPFRNSSTLQKQRRSSGTPRQAGYPSPPMSASPNKERFIESKSGGPSSHRNAAFGGYRDHKSTRSMDGNTPSFREARGTGDGGLRRGNSLSERFPGDRSHEPLKMIERDALRAQRAPHLRKKHLPRTDLIDSLDVVGMGGPYHHGGPYDAALFAVNNNPRVSPLEAVKDSNEAAIRATPHAKVVDSLRKHRPLEGVSSVPSGERDIDGNVMEYEEGTDLMVEGGYKRWANLVCDQQDLLDT